MKETVHIVDLPGGNILIHFKFFVKGKHTISCGIGGSFCVEDFGSFPIVAAKILLESKVINILSIEQLRTSPIGQLFLFILLYLLNSKSIFVIKATSVDLSMARGIWRANEWGPLPPIVNTIPSPCMLLIL